MVDVVGEALAYASLPIALVVGALVVWWLRGSWLPARIAAACLAVAALVALMALSWAMAWRDGLGPDGVVHTEGLAALRKSLSDLPLTLLLIAAGLTAVGLALALLVKRRRLVRGATVG